MATAVADEYGPFDAGAGSDIGEPQWGRILASLTSSGVTPGVLNRLAVTQHGWPTGGLQNMSVDVASGQAFLNGHQARWVGVTNLAIAANLSGVTRYDRVVARSNRTTNICELDVLQGAGGVPAALTQNEVIWESLVAQVTVANGASTIVNASISSKPDWGVGRNGAPSALAFTEVGTGTGIDVPNGVTTVINLQQPFQDSLGYWSVAHPSRFTIPESGMYLVGAQVYIDDSNVGANANIGKGATSFTVLENGGTSLQCPQFSYWGETPVAGATAPYNFAPTTHQFSCASLMQLAATEYLEFAVTQYSGSTKKTFGMLYVVRLGVA